MTGTEHWPVGPPHVLTKEITISNTGFDDGIGIAPGIITEVFDLFVQADHAITQSQGGLGIGLTLIKNLVEMHGGTITAHSDGLGKGSEFTLRLPLANTAVQDVDHNKQTSPSHATMSSPSRLIVVDDNKDAAQSLAMLLHFQGRPNTGRCVSELQLSPMSIARSYSQQISPTERCGGCRAINFSGNCYANVHDERNHRFFSSISSSKSPSERPCQFGMICAKRVADPCY